MLGVRSLKKSSVGRNPPQADRPRITALDCLRFGPVSHEERLKIRAVGCIWIACAIGAALGARFGQAWGKGALLAPAGVMCLSAAWAFVFWYRQRS